MAGMKDIIPMTGLNGDAALAAGH